MAGSDVDITPVLRVDRKRWFVWAGIVVGALLAVAVLMWIWMGNQKALVAATEAEEQARIEAEQRDHIRIAAVADAQALTVAIDNALAASQAFNDDMQLALVYLESTAIPVRDVIADATEEFGEGQEGELNSAIEAVSTSMSPPVVVPESADAVYVEIPAESGVVSESASEAYAIPPATTHGVEPWAITLEYLGPDAGRHAGELQRHYEELDDQARDVARGAVATETDRFDALAAKFIEASAVLASHVEDVDLTIQRAISAAIDVGTTTQGDVGDASEEALDELEATTDALVALTELEVATEWETRTPDEPSALTGVVDAVNDYLSATDAARSSHEANRAPEPYICYAYRWGGPHPTYCWD